MTATLSENIEKLLPNAFRDSNSGKACRDAILASCEPGFYKLDFGDLIHLDGANAAAALALLTYRLNEMDSVQRLMAPDQFQRLHDSWDRDNPMDDNGQRDFWKWKRNNN